MHILLTKVTAYCYNSVNVISLARSRVITLSGFHCNSINSKLHCQPMPGICSSNHFNAIHWNYFRGKQLIEHIFQWFWLFHCNVQNYNSTNWNRYKVPSFSFLLTYANIPKKTLVASHIYKLNMFEIYFWSSFIYIN